MLPLGWYTASFYSRYDFCSRPVATAHPTESVVMSTSKVVKQAGRLASWLVGHTHKIKQANIFNSSSHMSVILCLPLDSERYSNWLLILQGWTKIREEFILALFLLLGEWHPSVWVMLWWWLEVHVCWFLDWILHRSSQLCSPLSVPKDLINFEDVVQSLSNMCFYGVCCVKTHLTALNMIFSVTNSDCLAQC